MATGTMLGALRGYFGVAAAVQGVRSAYKEYGESVPPEIQTALSATITAMSHDAALIVSQLNERRTTFTAGPEADLLDTAIRIVPLVYDETVAWPGGGTMGLSKVGVGAVEVAVKAAFELGPWLKKAIGWIIAAGATIVGATLYIDWRRSMDPMYGVAKAFEMDAFLQTRREADMARCAGNRECEAKVDAKYNRMYTWAFDKILKPGGAECGLLDTPRGTIIGGLVGAGLGWAGMRRLMRT